MKFILLSLALAATAVTHCNAEGSCFAMHGTSSSGTLEPAGVRTSTDCHIILAADSGPKLRITLTNIDMPYTAENYDYYRDEYNPYYEEINLDKPQFDNITCEEWLEVRDGPSQDSKLLGEYCGDKELLSLPITVRSSGKFVWVRFKTNDRASEATFHLQYRPESSDTICREDGIWKNDCLSDETCVFDGVYNKVFVHKCAKKLAPGSVCQDDSWCGETECPAGHECVSKCENGRCTNHMDKILKPSGSNAGASNAGASNAGAHRRRRRRHG